MWQAMKPFRTILKGVSLTAAMFVFQACYGTMPAGEVDEAVTFRVVDGDGLPLPDVKILSQRLGDSEEQTDDWYLLGYTDSAGEMAFGWDDMGLATRFRFDSQDAHYGVKDTVIDNLYGGTVDIVLPACS